MEGWDLFRGSWWEHYKAVSQMVTYSLQSIPNDEVIFALPGNTCILLRYYLGRGSCSTTVRGTYDAEDEDGIETTRMTADTPLIGEVVCHELLWLVWNRLMMNMILGNKWHCLFLIRFLVSRSICPLWIYTHVCLCCIGYVNPIDRKVLMVYIFMLRDTVHALYSASPLLNVCITLI